MMFVLLAWILLAPLGAWIIGSAVSMADKRSFPAAQTADEHECPAEELAAVPA